MMTYRTPEEYIYQGRLAPRPSPQPCIRCTRNLDTAAKAARSEVCTTCASLSGELSPIGLLPLTEFRTWEEYYLMLSRLDE